MVAADSAAGAAGVGQAVEGRLVAEAKVVVEGVVAAMGAAVAWAEV
jgi:hypothetical protein